MERTVEYVKGSTWRLWSQYWEDKKPEIPPLHFLRRGAGDEAIFACALSPEELTQFLAAMKTEPELEFTLGGDWVLDTYSWFGWWGIFVVRPKSVDLKPRRN